MAKVHPNVSLVQRKGRPGWYLRVTYAGQRRELNAGPDKKAADRKAMRISAELELVRQGHKQLAEVLGEAKSTSPVGILVEEWVRSLKSRLTTDYHQHTLKQRVTDLFQAAGVQKLTKTAGQKVLAALVSMLQANTSVQTVKHYRQAVKQFEKWAIKHSHFTGGAVIANATSEMKLVAQTDRRAKGRAWTREEFDKLMKYLAESQVMMEKHRSLKAQSGVGLGLGYRYRKDEMVPADKARLYDFAVKTMLRAGEISRLTTDDLVLDGDQPKVIVRAKSSKNRKEQSVPLARWYAKKLKQWIGDRTGKVFEGLPVQLGHMLEKDVKAAGIRYKTTDGTAHFHSLRHTGGAWLCWRGTNIKTLQEMLRHGTASLTLDTYGHHMKGDAREVVESMWAEQAET